MEDTQNQIAFPTPALGPDSIKGQGSIKGSELSKGPAKAYSLKGEKLGLCPITRSKQIIGEIDGGGVPSWIKTMLASQFKQLTPANDDGDIHQDQHSSSGHLDMVCQDFLELLKMLLQHGDEPDMQMALEHFVAELKFLYSHPQTQ